MSEHAACCDTKLAQGNLALFSELLGILILLGVVAIGVWQFREIIAETDLDRLQRRAILILIAGAAGWVLYLLMKGL